MVLSQKITAEIRDVLQKNPQGLSITGIVNTVKINRNTAGRYLDSLLASGQVEMRHFGMAKIYTLSHRVPLSAVLSISSELIMQLDSDLRIIYANEPFISFFGTTQKDLFGKNIQYSMLVPVLDDLFEPFMERIRRGLDGIEWSGELSLQQQEIIFACRIAPTVFDNGNKGVSVILDDITGRKEGEERVRKSEELYRSLAETSQDLIFVIDEQDRVEYVNSYAAAALQKSYEEIIGTDRNSIFPPDINRRQKDSLRRVFFTGEPHRSETAIPFQGTVRWFDHVLMPLKNPDGSVRAVLGVSRDITERKRAEESLKNSEERYRRLLQRSFDAVVVHRDGIITVANQAAATLVGASSPSELIGKKILDFVHPAFRDIVRERMEAMTSGDSMSAVDAFEEKFLMIDGKAIDVEVVATGFLDDGRPTIQVVFRDITRRKQMENALRESETRYRRLEESLRDAYVLVAMDGRLRGWNFVYRNMLGYSDDELAHLTYFDITPVKWHEAEAKIVTEQILPRGHSEVYEKEYRRKDGTIFPVELRTFLLRDGEGRADGMWAIIRDITGRKRAEEALQQSEDRFRRIFEDGPIAMAILDKAYRFVTVNRRFCEMLGYSPEELRARTFVDITHPAHVDQDLAAIKKLYAGGIATYRTKKRYIRKDGSVITGSLTVSPLMDKEGRIVSTLALVEDITERKQIGK